MKERFTTPPLREIVAELTWDQHDDVVGQDPSEPVFHRAYEETFNDFLDRVGERGYTRSERLVPQDFPCPPEQVILRVKHSNFRKGVDSGSKVLYQIGMGVFTVNALPPYESWDEFSPLVEAGLKDFFSLSLPGGNPDGYRLKLRYINAFGEELTQGRSHKEFLCDVLGVAINLPESVLDQASREFELPFLDIVLPLDFGKMRLRFGEGLTNDEKTFILDLTVNYSSEYTRDVEAVMNAYSEGRNSIHNVFVNMTKNLHKEMGLIGSVL